MIDKVFLRLGMLMVISTIAIAVYTLPKNKIKPKRTYDRIEVIHDTVINSNHRTILKISDKYFLETRKGIVQIK